MTSREQDSAKSSLTDGAAKAPDTSSRTTSAADPDPVKVPTAKADGTVLREATGAKSLSDEGIPYAAHETEPGTLVNLSANPVNNPFELHLGGRVYTHVGTDSKGRWTYRAN
jgi:uncharacterized membrane protein